MVFIAIFNTISVLLAEKTGVPRENHWQIWSHSVLSSTPRHERGSDSLRYW